MTDVLDELRVGEKVSEGRFRIDQKRALQKLRSSRLADPSHWVLDVLRAAQASGATSVAVSTDADDVEVSFDGRPFPAAVMRDLLSQALGATDGKQDVRHRLFSLGVAGAMGVGLQRLRARSGKVALAIDAQGEVTVTEVPAGPTALEVRKALSWRVAAAWFGGESPEERAILKNVLRFGPKLVLNRKVRKQIALPRPRYEKDGVRVWADPIDEWTQSELDLDVLGVFVARRHLELPGIQLDAVVQCDELRRNASGTDVVDDDPNLLKALDACRRLSLDLLVERAQEPTDAIRALVASRLLDGEGLDDAAKKVLLTVPLFRGPAGEFHSVTTLTEAAKDGRPLYIASSAYPKGSYPQPCVLFDAEARRWNALLPKAKREDVAAVVRRNQRAAENRLAWEAQPPEELALPGRAWLATHPLELAKSKLSGQVGIEARGSGAFVRLLCQGRFLQEGEVALLAPLRLRAVVNLEQALSDKAWAEVPSNKLWSQIVGAVDDAAEQAIIAGLSQPEPDPAIFSHVRDLLIRRANDGPGGLPAAVRAAPLFECLDGPRASLDGLESEGRWRFVPRRYPHPPLDSKRVLVLDTADRLLLAPYAKGRLTDVSEQLDRELEIRRRLSGPKVPPVVPSKLVAVPFERDGMKGEVAICADPTDRLELSLLREGFLLERTTQTARYGPVAAAVDCPALTPSSDWSKALRDAAFDSVLRAVREAERELARPLVERFKVFNGMPKAAAAWLLAFAKKELDGKEQLDEVARAVFEAKLLDGPEGPISLAELKGRAQRTGHLWLVPAWRSVEALEGQAAVAGVADADTLLHLGTGFEPEDGVAELQRASARAEFLERPEHEPAFGDRAPLYVAFSHEGLPCTAALDRSEQPAASVNLVADGRLWREESLSAALPMKVEVQLPGLQDPALPPDEGLLRQLRAAVQLAQEKMTSLALDQPERPGAGRAAFFALASHLDGKLPPDTALKLVNATLFECTDGVTRSAAGLDALDEVPFVTARLEGAPRSGSPVVLALDPDVLKGLERFDRADVTATLKLELKTRAARLELPQVEQVRFSGAALLTRPVHGYVEGEVVLAPAAEGRLELLMDRRPLCVVPGALPLPLAAAVNCDALHPSPAHDGVDRDAAFRKAVDALLEHVEPLATELAERWSELEAHPAALESALRLCAMLGTRKKQRSHPLLMVPLLKTTDGRGLAVGWLLEKQKAKEKIPISDREGSLLGKTDRKVWRADVQQRRWLEPLKLEVRDMTGELESAQRVRARPKVPALTAPVEGPWREKIDSGGIEGEIALPPRPDRELHVEVYTQRTLLERYGSDHPVGGVAAVNFDKLTPNPSWTKAARNAQFRTLLNEVQSAHGRLLARRLQQRDATWRPWAVAAVMWSPPELSAALPALELFETLAGAPVTVGAALAEYARARRVAVAKGELDAGGQLVLKDGDEARQLLEALGVTVKDVSDELMRRGEREAERRSRRLGQLSWPGDALVRVKVHAPGIGGELALPAGEEGVEVTLAKQGVRVRSLPPGHAPGVAGVVDIEALDVDERWSDAKLKPAEREAIERATAELLEALCHVAPSLSKERKALARRHVLTWLEHAGVSSAVHLDRLTGASAALARAPVFETSDGEWVALSVLGDEVRRRGRVAIFERSLFRPDTAGALGLWVKSHREPWLDELEKVLGPGTLERVKDASSWRETLREEDPAEGTAELWGLQRLRRDVRLLRAGALGELSPEDVEDVRLRPLGGGAPLHYDVKRKVVLLDAEHGQVQRALAESKVRRERLYVLLAAMYGAINRALERITDRHEEELSAALAAHLAANPHLLDGEEDRSR